MPFLIDRITKKNSFGLLLGGFGLYKYKTGTESVGWPAVKGRITYSHAQPRKAKTGSEYLPSVRYAYKVNGKSYTGTRISASELYFKSLGRARDRLRNYPVGGEVSVRYEPDNPGNSLLETGLPGNVYGLLGGAVACLFLAGAVTVSAFKKGRTG